MGHGNSALKKPIHDTPMHGKQCSLVIQRKRYRCSNCGGTHVAALNGVASRFGSTQRLVEYVESLCARMTIAAIAAHVGMRAARVARIVQAVIGELEQGHAFETPEVLGMDDLRLRRVLYTVFTNGRTGEAIGIIKAGDSAAISGWIIANLDRTKVTCVVSDLAPVNIAAVKRAWPAGVSSPADGSPGRPLHIGDKWHVIKGAQKALTAVVNRELNRLRSQGGQMAGDAELLARLRPMLLRGVTAQREEEGEQAGAGQVEQLVFSFDSGFQSEADMRAELKRFLDRYETISRAFWAKIRLHRLYNAASPEEAERHGESFQRQCRHPLIARDFGPVANTVQANWSLVLNFFRASPTGDHSLKAAVTNGPTERRNSMIRQAWRASKGMTNFRYLRLRALYEPVDLRGLLSQLRSAA